MTSTKENTKDLSQFQLANLLKTDKENLLEKILQLGLQQLMELERDHHIEAERYERCDERQTTRNGYKPRQLHTRVGSLNLRVPKTRDGTFYPSILERYQRSEKALVAALSEGYVQGVSTRKMAKVTEQLLGTEFSASTINRFSAELDAELAAWRTRPLTRDYPYVKIDARYERCRRDGQIVSMAVLVAIGVGVDGHRHVLAVETGWGGVRAGLERFYRWPQRARAFGRGNVHQRRPSGHPGGPAIPLSGYAVSPRIRDQFHFLHNAIDKVPKKREEYIEQVLKQIWRKENTARQAEDQLDELLEELSGPLPEVADWLSEAAPQTLTVFRVAPKSHRRRVRTTNAVERLHQELKRRSKVVRIFPTPASCLRLFGAMLKEQHEDWITGRRYLRMDKLKEFQKNRNFSSPDSCREKKTLKPAMA